jgi:hypothetical protein
MSPIAIVLVLTASGLALVAIGIWRGYALARRALEPLAHEGDATRTAIEALRPLPFRPRVRTFAQRVLLAVGWLMVALYGLYLIVRGQDWLQ